MNRKIAVLILIIVLASILPLTVSSNIVVGVKAGDWIEYNSSFSGTPPYSTYQTGLKIEFLSVQGTNVTLKFTSQLSDSSQSTYTYTVDLNIESIELLFLIPAELSNGDSLYDEDFGVILISEVIERTYVGVRRTTLFASIPQWNTTLYWDKITGVLVESSLSETNYTHTLKVVKTNMWKSGLFGLPISPTFFYILIIITVIMTLFIILKLKASKKTNKNLQSSRDLKYRLMFFLQNVTDNSFKVKRLRRD